MILILIFILILNIVAIALTYYCLSHIEKKERIIFIGVGIAITYILTSFVYWLSTKDVAIKEVSELGKNLITFLFVPINSIIVLPIFAKSYNKYKIGSLASDKLRNRTIILAIILLILLIAECSYFKDIQNSVVILIKKNNEKDVEEQQSILNSITENIISNTENINTEVNQTSNDINNETTNAIENTISNTVNQID